MRPSIPEIRPVPSAGTSGFSLLEALVGMVVLCMLMVGVVALSKTSIQGNSIAKDSAAGYSVLKGFIEDMRGINLDSLPRNTEVRDTSGSYLLAWTAYDESSPGAYRQPAGLVLICARLSYERNGVIRQIETSTLLGRK